MPIQPYNPLPFELEVSDRTQGQTTVKQKFHFDRLEHSNAARTCIIHGTVRPFAVAAGGGYGPALVGGPFTAYPVALAAENNTIVDMRDGSILAVRYAPREDGTPGTDVHWQADIARIEASAVPAMYQGDYFCLIRDTQPLVIGDLIRQHILNANALGRFA